MSDVKTCNTCQITKPVSEFWRRSRTRDGLEPSCRVCVRRRQQNWAGRNPEKLRQAKRRYQRNNPPTEQKRQARRAVEFGLLDGTLSRPEQCARCDAPCRPDAHHADYQLPLEIEWLCRRCHAAEHMEVR